MMPVQPVYTWPCPLEFIKMLKSDVNSIFSIPVDATHLNSSCPNGTVAVAGTCSVRSRTACGYRKMTRVTLVLDIEFALSEVRLTSSGKCIEIFRDTERNFGEL